MFKVTREFIGGNLSGLTYTSVQVTSAPVGTVIANPVGGSPYRITSVQPYTGPYCGSCGNTTARATTGTCCNHH